MKFGLAHVFYPVNTEACCSATLLLDIDPIELFRSQRHPKNSSFALHQYVNDRQLLQPALKCCGQEYLRIIYGPEYSTPEHLEALRQRSVGLKRLLAVREFSLGGEALTRFVERQPLRRVHECVFGVLALESEPVDPRL